MPPSTHELEISNGDAAEPNVESTKREARPGVFLMSNSLETGGSERQFSALARRLDREQFHVHLGCIMRKGPFLAGLDDVTEFELGGSLYHWPSIRTRLGLARHLKRNDIAIAHAFDFYTNLTLIPAARWARVPVVIGSQRQLGNLLTWRQEHAQSAVLRWCDAVVCNSRAAARRLRELGLREDRLTVVANGLPEEAFAEAQPALPRIASLRVGMIARMNTRAKNHHVFLQAAASLAAHRPDVQFVLVGDGPLRPGLELLARELGIADRVTFLGERQDIPAVLASLDISVLPSQSESLSNVIIEAMAAGVPIVASSVGGNCELITEERGVLVQPEAEMLASAIERLLRNRDLRMTLASNARVFARANFTLEQMTKRHMELYQALLERKRGRRKPAVAGNPSVVSKKVAIVAASPRYVGGQSVQADILLRHWRDDPEVEAKFVPIDPPFPFALRWAERIPVLRTLMRQPLYMFQLWRGLKDVEIAHIFSASYWSFLVAPAPAWFMAKAMGKKVLIHYHSGEARDHLQRFRSARPVLRKADRLVVPSQYLVDVFREFDLKAQIIPNIIDTRQFLFRVRRPLRPHLIGTRGFHPYYCVDVVVRAFAKVKSAFPEARLDLLGIGPCEAQVRKLVEDLNLMDVEFKGSVAHSEIGHYYDEADIFINASHLDNMPVSILEAFASGTPVVTTEPEGMRYIVKHECTGLLSPPGDHEALARNVIRVLQDADLAQSLISNARCELERYSWPAVRKQWLAVYRDRVPSITKT